MTQTRFLSNEAHPFLVLLLAIAACTVERSKQLRHDGFSRAWIDSTGAFGASVDYGYTDKHLHFMVFESGHREIIPHAKITETGTQPEGSSLCEGYIELPDGTKPDLPTSNRIYEFTFGAFTSAR